MCNFCRHQADALSSPGWQEHQRWWPQARPGPGVPGVGGRAPQPTSTHTHMHSHTFPTPYPTKKKKKIQVLYYLAYASQTPFSLEMSQDNLKVHCLS